MFSQAGVTSTDHQPTKSGVKTGYIAVNGHLSQIPGLSPTISSPPADKVRGRRAGVLESDSDYVKLAKQGGHKGLLWHEETVAANQNAYKPPDWFCTASGDNSNPSEDKKNHGAFQPPEAPFGNDNMSSWERDDSNNKTKMEKSTNQNHETSKFKRLVFDKRPAPIDMSKLLSFGYAEGNKPIAN
ncbi:uncharacterized protein C7orf57 homolog [Echeneis naucrates]|uniref:uncharacterized protein C7orf57 homolog n=1 Tax=Echeneis naucrates TaxID=173247 RepID=UPI0011137138|nr:uncharacterized protein C7orf57 homolog [Echeneis naucrates]